MLATSDYGHELQQDLNAIVGCDEKFNNAIVRHALDTKNAGIFHNPNPNNLTVCDGKTLIFKIQWLQKLQPKLRRVNWLLMQDDIINTENRLEN